MVERNGEMVQQYPRNVIWMRQSGVKIPMKRKDDWPGLPDMEQVLVKGETTWDSSKRMAFVEDYIRQQFMPVLEGFEPIGESGDIEPQAETGDISETSEAAIKEPTGEKASDGTQRQFGLHF